MDGPIPHSGGSYLEKMSRTGPFLGRSRRSVTRGGPCPLPSRERPLALPLDRGRGVAFFACARWCTTARCGPGAEGRDLLCTRRSPGLTTPLRTLTPQASRERDLLAR